MTTISFLKDTSRLITHEIPAWQDAHDQYPCTYGIRHSSDPHSPNMEVFPTVISLPTNLDLTSEINIPISPNKHVTLHGNFPISVKQWEQMIKVLDAMKPGLVSSDIKGRDKTGKGKKNADD